MRFAHGLLRERFARYRVMGQFAGTAPVYIAFATYVPDLSVVATTLHSLVERWRSQVVLKEAAAPGCTVWEPVAIHAAQSAVDQIWSEPDTTRSTNRPSSTTTQTTEPVFLIDTSSAAVAPTLTWLGPFTESSSRLGAHSVGAVALALGAEGVAEADGEALVDGVGLDDGGSLEADVAAAADDAAGAAVCDPRIAETMAAMMATTTMRATSTRPRRTQYTRSGS